jgi:pyruvate dehydrogenase complex dehydrogenase (E1) component
MMRYHDTEWGVPLHDDRRLYEFLVLDAAQAGLSWQTVLLKRENYRKAFDGFGRSDTREALRRFFEIDAECVTVAALHALAQRGAVERQAVAQAIKDLNVDPEKAFPQLV